MTTDAPAAAHPLEAQRPIEQRAAADGPQLHLAQATLSEVRAANKQPPSAETLPLEIHGKGERIASDHTGGGDGDGATKPAPESDQATAESKNLEGKLDQARQQFGQAQTPEQREAALKQFQSIIGSSDSNFQHLQSAVEAEAERFNPGSAAAAKALGTAVDKMVDETEKLGDKIPQIAPDLEQWSKATADGKSAIEQQLRDKGFSGLADAMADTDKVQKDYASVFARGEQTEDHINQQFGPGLDAAMKARLEARSDYQSALLMAGKNSDAEAVGRETDRIRLGAAHLSPIKSTEEQ